MKRGHWLAIVALAPHASAQESFAHDPELQAFVDEAFDELAWDSSIAKRVEADLRVGPVEHAVLRPLVTEDSADSSGEGAYIGFDYVYSRSWDAPGGGLGPLDRTYWGVRAQGFFPFQDGDIKPFASHRLTASYGMLLSYSPVQNIGVTRQELYNEAESLMDIYGFRSPEELKGTSYWEDYLGTTRTRIRNQERPPGELLLIGGEYFVGTENDHNFDEGRLLLGAEGTYLIRTASIQNRFIDYLDSPFALGRWMLGEGFAPSFGNWALNIGGRAEYVVPYRDGAREDAAGDDDPFGRGTLLGDTGILLLDNGALHVDGTLGVRLTNEFDPPEGVRRAGLAYYNFVEATVRLNHIWSISWKSGMLPFDTEQSQSFSLGLEISDRL